MASVILDLALGLAAGALLVALADHQHVVRLERRLRALGVVEAIIRRAARDDQDDDRD